MPKYVYVCTNIGTYVFAYCTTVALTTLCTRLARTLSVSGNTCCKPTEQSFYTHVHTVYIRTGHTHIHIIMTPHYILYIHTYVHMHVQYMYVFYIQCMYV